MPVDRCVCRDVTFAQLKHFADQHGCGFDELRERFGCGRGCGLCEPYVREMLRTGITSFAPMPVQGPAPLGDSPTADSR